MRMAHYLTERRIPFETLIHPPAFTAQKRAKFLHTPGRHVVKSVLLIGPRGYFLAILPATQRVNLDELSRHLEGPVRLANSDELAQVFPDCEWGVAAPFGTLYGLPTFLDDSLTPDAPIILELNTHAEAIRIRCGDFEQVENPLRLRFSCP